jgi:ABC-2 type transport system ATP-binding protein
MSITLRNVCKSYNNQAVLNNVSFEVSPGEIVGFLGPNGAGKSTTMKIITGFIEANSGEVTVLGQKVSKENKATKASIGYLPEHNPMYPSMYVKEFLELTGGLYGMRGAVLQQKIAELIEKVGLTAEQSKKIGQLSKGYKQRVGLAQALIHQPEVLILDEPTSGLDPNQLVEIRKLIKTESANKAVLFSSHIMQEVEAICDRLLIINKGEIVAQGTVAELKKEGGNLEEIFRKLTN